MSHRFADSGEKFTLESVRKKLREVGVTISKDTVAGGPTGSGEYRVTFRKDAWPGLTSKKAEDMACYETSLEAALATGRAMAREAREKGLIP